MSGEIQSSFIPKKPLTEKAAYYRGSNVGLATLISLFFLLLSGLAYGGVFLYRLSLEKEIGKPDDDCAEDGGKCSLKASIRLTEEKVRKDLINEIKKTAGKIQTAKGLTGNHVSLTPIFDALEELTLTTVRFTSFKYEKGEAVLSGTAESYEAVAVQSDVLNGDDKGRIISHSFSDLKRDDKGNVSFSLKIAFEPSFIKYKAEETTADNTANDASVSTTTSNAAGTASSTATSTNP